VADPSRAVARYDRAGSGYGSDVSTGDGLYAAA
jgi:hypothetical protein